MIFLYFVFFFSGISALIYQVTWQRLLTVYYGVGSVSITLIVSIYMLGLGLGSLLGGWLAERDKEPIKLYFFIELGIGIFGLVSFPLIIFIGKYTAGSPFIWAAIYEAAVLLIPTMLMGMALPILIKIFRERVSDITRSLSILYFVNTFGAAAGALIASFILISFYGIAVAIYVAAVINVVLALIILMTGNLYKKNSIKEFVEPIPSSSGSGFACPLLLVFVTGFLAIGYELIWFRIIGVLVKSSPYAFASVLAVYLVGIALGSFLISKIIKNFSEKKKIRLFYVIQVCLAVSVAAIFILYYYLTLSTPLKHLTNISFTQGLHPPVYLLRLGIELRTLLEYCIYFFRLGTIIIWPTIFMLVPTMLMGASFPLIAGLISEKSGREVWTVGKVYFYNILGNVAGGVVTGFILLPWVGTELTIISFVLIGLAFALPILIRQRSFLLNFGLGVVALAIIIFFPKKSELYHVMHPELPKFKKYFSEGLDGVVMTYVGDNGTVENYINGDSHGGRPGYGFYVQVLETAYVAKSLENVLVIGYGTGSFVEGILKIKGVEKVTVVELNRTLLNNLRQVPLFQALMDDPRLEFVIDDGRRYLQSHQEKYDLVLMSPLRATTAYSNNVYSKQFFELVLSRLDEEGVLSVWSDSWDAVFRTLDTVFLYKKLHLGHMQGFFLASQSPLKKNDLLELNSFVRSFGAVDRQNIFDTSNRYRIIPQEVMRQVANHYPPIEDWRPMTEYFLGIRKNHFRDQQGNKPFIPSGHEGH